MSDEWEPTISTATEGENYPPWNLAIGESIVRALYIDVKDGEPISLPRVRITRIDDERFDVAPVCEDRDPLFEWVATPLASAEPPEATD